MAKKQKPKKPDMDKSLHRVYNGIDTVHSLPTDIYLYNAGTIMNGVDSGFRSTVEFGSPDYKMYEAIGDNVYIFSAAKTFQQTMAMSNEIVKDGQLRTFAEFKEAAGPIFQDFNENYLHAEYATAITGASSAKKWAKAQREKKTFPYLVWRTSGDETVCPICGPMDGFTAKADSGEWHKAFPPLHFRCNCMVDQVDQEEIDDPDSDEEVSTPEEVREINAHLQKNVDKTFHGNTGITGQIFSSSHPYFQIPKEYKSLAKDNFNLPIPEGYGRYHN
jgi:SPP1 gp7 family putative phage head morphogenesis protein